MTSTCHVLNSSAGLVLDLASEDGRVSIIIDQLEAQTGAPRDALTADVTAALNSFRSSGLLRADGDDPHPEVPPARTLNPALGTRSEQRARWAPFVARCLSQYSHLTSACAIRLAGTTIELRTNSPAVADRFDELTASLSIAETAESTVWVIDRGTRRRRALAGAHRRRAAGPHRRRGQRRRGAAHAAQPVGRRRLLTECPAPRRCGRARRPGRRDRRTQRPRKSTLTAALVKNGFNYLTDELVVIDPTTLEVTPYPKSIDLSPASKALLGIDQGTDLGGKSHVAPSHLGSVSAGGRLALLVLLSPPDEAGETPGIDAAHELSPVNTLVDLLPSTFAETFALANGLDVLSANLRDDTSHRARSDADRPGRRRRDRRLLDLSGSSPDTSPVQVARSSPRGHSKVRSKPSSHGLGSTERSASRPAGSSNVRHLARRPRRRRRRPIVVSSSRQIQITCRCSPRTMIQSSPTKASSTSPTLPATSMRAGPAVEGFPKVGEAGLRRGRA